MINLNNSLTNSAAALTYVPYNGATADIDLNSHSLGGVANAYLGYGNFNVYGQALSNSWTPDPTLDFEVIDSYYVNIGYTNSSLRVGNGAVVIQDNAFFFHDDSNNGITSQPGSPMDIFTQNGAGINLTANGGGRVAMGDDSGNSFLWGGGNASLYSNNADFNFTCEQSMYMKPSYLFSIVDYNDSHSYFFINGVNGFGGSYPGAIGIGNVTTPTYQVDIHDYSATGYDIGNHTTGLWNITNTGNITANSFIKTSGTSDQFLKADGTADNTLKWSSQEVGHSIQKTSNYTIASDDSLVICGANGATITLPTAASSTGRIITVKNASYSGGSNTLASAGGNIDGVATVLLASTKSRTVQSDGTYWHVIGGVF